MMNRRKKEKDTKIRMKKETRRKRREIRRKGAAKYLNHNQNRKKKDI